MDSSMDFLKPKLHYGVVSWQTWLPKKRGYKLEGKLHIVDFEERRQKSALSVQTLCGREFRPGVIAGATLRSDSAALMAVVIQLPEMCKTCRTSLETGGAGFIVTA